VFGRVGAAFSGIFSRGDDDSRSSRSSGSSRRRSRSSQPKTPQIESSGGFDLDTWLDILGIGLVFIPLMLLASALSSTQGTVGAIMVFFGQLVGWGDIGILLLMMAVGVWLIVRHFGENAPTVDPLRVAGAALAGLVILVTMQYIDSFSYTHLAGHEGTVFRQLLQDSLNYAWEQRQAGGGFVGAWFYYQLVINFTELGGVFIVLFAGVISAMLMFRVSASEIALFMIGLWRGLRDYLQQQARKRRAERKIAQQKAAQQQQAEQPAPAMASAQSTAAPQQPSQMPLEGREIRFNRGNQQQMLNPSAPQQTGTQQPAYAGGQPVASQQNENSSGGFFSFFRGSSESSSSTPSDDSGGLLGGLLSFGGNGGNQTAPPVNALPEQPLPMDDDYSQSASSGQRPAAYDSSSNTIRLGDYLKPGDDMPPPPPDYATAGNGGSQKQQDDTLRARQARLDALRRGETGPLSQANMARAGSNGGNGSESDSYPAAREPAQQSGAFGKPDDRITHPSENIPFGKANVVSADGSDQAYQQHLAAEPQKAQSSRVTSGRAVPDWETPDYTTLLSRGSDSEIDREHLLRQAKIIEETLVSFGAPGRVVEINTGPVITQFGVEPDYQTSSRGKKQRVKVSAIAALDKDLQLALGARSIRVEAPVPGKGYVGIEVPNEEPTLVSLRDVIDSPGFAKHKSPLAIALGQNVAGAPISADLTNMPHLLIAGTTGSGKSVCVNSIITSIISRHTPDEVKFIMVDPKRVELTGYNGIPHLVSDVVTDLERIVGVLKWVTREMDARYKKFSEAGARNIEDFNRHRNPDTENPMPYMVVIIDELADLMMLAPEETERTITRIAALARATGIHLVIATQRPSVDVVTGLIKANFPARIAFAVASGTDSRVILDQPGAERLLGKGDMLYLSGDSPAPVRLQGTFVSDMEINNIVRYWKMQARRQPPARDLTFAQSKPSKVAESVNLNVQQKSLAGFGDDSSSESGSSSDDSEDVELTRRELTGDVKKGNEDELYDKAVALVRKLDKASISLLQRRLRIGYTRAARLIDVMEARNVVGPEKTGSSKPRDVIPYNEDSG
jgi:DNA segregation ATPase FtsK/SpoIIIE-like protein